MSPAIVHPVRAALAWALALAALLFALAPWIGRWVPPADALSSALPLAPVLALSAALLARAPAPRLAALAALLLAAPVLIEEVWPRTAPIGAASRRVVVVTHNLFTLNADPQRTAAILLASGADILLLQEADGAALPVIDRLRTRFPFGSECRRPCSLLILSRWPTTRVRYRYRDASGRPFGPALEQTQVRVPGLPPIGAATLHLSRHRGWMAEAAERASLADAVRRQADPTLVMAGDFNLTPWSAALHALDGALLPLRRVTRAAFSWPARLGGHAFPVPLAPIDQLYAGPRWAVGSVRRLPRTGSDHYPLRVELVWQGET